MPTTLLAVPNVSEGRDAAAIAAIGAAFAADGVRLLDTHSDPDHHRSVYTLAGEPGALAPALAAGVAEAVARIDLRANTGIHPHVGAADVVPVVHLDDARRGAACAEALVAADLIGRLGVPVLMYGALADGRSRADLRRGGAAALAARLAARDLAPDFGPAGAHPTAGITLCAARPPLIAFNLELAPPATVQDARRIAAAVREGGEDGLPGVRALGLWLDRAGVAQVSCNVEDHVAVPLRDLVAAVRARAPVTRAEVIGVPPASALDGFPSDVPTPGFDPETGTVEARLGGS